ncbi:MAG: osmoprotectant NAGGN system M42 family peptidase [Gammaproteobacteria bacterium]|nr:osmoprotectant NAGGN system M42 family peptidase [Gammaproteobacteria bacterium]MBU1506083.1 osmoprotectant NAGGN system M42 family peptidase [Gammaproteobacteria bacterium]MBU2119712.1 osmoprotectant NAGGN system M42 family peptidase [Gammaproteobacteria bacterium]MBU2170284.1 osmoprotectant NAGGN system M42 family peptidase [Gammaproteobacteria bacterium]MBU2202899.1 osmoprotectant NAGGN system M42 family peptidase [Gammaproteobacteria bacterium]
MTIDLSLNAPLGQKIPAVQDPNHPVAALPPIDPAFLEETLLHLMAIPSPVGLTDGVVRYVAGRLDEVGIPYEITRRGAIRATLRGREARPARAVVAHLDTLGAMVREIKPNGRLGVVPIGHWSSRFAEGGRLTVFTDTGQLRGTCLPLKTSGHAFGAEVDTQPSDWAHVEVRVDVESRNAQDLQDAGIHVGDWIAFDPQLEILPNGYMTSRYLDDKAAVAALLAACKALVDSGLSLPVDAHPLFTITEEVGSGSSAALHGDIAEMVSLDIAIAAPGQNTDEHAATICFQDMSGPFDYHLTHKLVGLANLHGIAHRRDVFKFYRSDSAAAVEAGNDIRTALIGFGADASHAHERTHRDALMALAQLSAAYMLSDPVAARDRRSMGPLEGFTEQLRPGDMLVPVTALPDPEAFLAADTSGGGA